MTGNQSKPWHPNRKHYRCSRRENLTIIIVIIMTWYGVVEIRIVRMNVSSPVIIIIMIIVIF